MELSTLTALSPIDGRYRRKTEELTAYFSEYALMKYRVLVEIEYFIALCELPLPQLAGFDHSNFSLLQNIYTDFQLTDAYRIKEIENTTNHDIKAIEYFIKEKFDILGLQPYREFIHFALTSQDINNTAMPLSVKDALENVYFPAIEKIIQQLQTFANEWKDVAMLARTHGQPASPTRLGKEINVFVERLTVQLTQLKQIPFMAKFGGATGNFNAHHVAYPAINWIDFANQFVSAKLKLNRSQYTTQIEHYDNMGACFDAIKRINTILIDFCRDVWTYISMDYFKQRIQKNEVSSSVMPHKVNPIDFENAEGNFGVANALFEHLSAKLPISRLQRDLTDSTVSRNIGVAVAHTLLAIKSLQTGLNKIILNTATIEADLNNNWNVISEAFQTILRREGFPNPYETLKELVRTGNKVDHQTIIKFVESLDIAQSVKLELLHITPMNYTGMRF